MKRFMLQIPALVCSLFILTGVKAQDLSNPGGYMSHMGKRKNELNVKYLSYPSAASHGKSMKKIEKRRADLLNSIYEVRTSIFDMPSFNGDKSLKDSAVSYLKLMYSVFNEDYAKIVDMEEIAEQSYDLMEAYLMAQEKANEKLTGAAQAFSTCQKDFAARNNVTLINEETEMDRKLEAAEKVTSYYNEVYLLFFKPYKQEMYLLEALEKQNTNAVEQNRSALVKNADEGLEKLKQMKGLNADRSLESACRQVLLFLKEEGETKAAPLSDYILRQQNFEQLKKDFENSKKTKQDVDNYNKAVEELNKGANAYNAVTQQLNAQRTKLLNEYNKTVATFMDTHMPHAR